MYFLALLLRVRAQQPCRFCPPAEDADRCEALLQAIRDKDARLGNKYLRGATIWSDQERAHIRLTCFSKAGGSLGSALLQALAPGSVLQCAVQRYEVESVGLTDPLWTGISTWPDMLSQPAGARLRFTFATPLITSDPERRPTGNALPFPDPQVLFTSTLRHWRLLDGPLLPYTGESLTQVARCVVSEYRLETAARVLTGHSYLGFLGWIEYLCRTRDTAVIASLGALARLAFFSGSGYLTERGMGVTAVTIAN